MRWLPFLLVVLAGVIVQNTIAQVLWFPTPWGWVGPEVLAAIAVFVALNVRGRTNAAIAGWALGLAVDLNLSGGGMGLLALLYAAGAAGLHAIRDAFFRDRTGPRMMLAFAFGLFAWELWTAYDVLVLGGGRGYWAAAGQAVCVAAYTALVSPLVFALMGKAARVIFVTAPGRDKR